MKLQITNENRLTIKEFLEQSLFQECDAFITTSDDSLELNMQRCMIASDDENNVYLISNDAQIFIGHTDRITVHITNNGKSRLLVSKDHPGRCIHLTETQQ